MPVTNGSPAPYAPSSAVLELISKHRNRGLPAPINFDVLLRAGVTDSLVPRTIQALKTLDLIDEDGKPTPTFEGLRLAPEPEYPQRMTEWLNTAYADVLCFVDPANADETTLRDAFRSYTPIGQQSRMVTLFTGLYSAAGVREDKPRISSTKRPKLNAAINVPGKRPTPRVAGVQNALENPPPPPPPPPPGTKPNPLVEALLSKFPDFDPTWSDDLKAKWFDGFEKFMSAASLKSSGGT